MQEVPPTPTEIGSNYLANRSFFAVVIFGCIMFALVCYDILVHSYAHMLFFSLNTYSGKSVRAEVRRIMGPSSSRGLGYSTSSTSLVGSGHINWKPKRKAKFELSKSVKKERVSTAKFQKKLVVFKYMGLDAVEKFTRADRRIAMHGLFPPIPLESTEDDVRREICEVIRSSSEFADCGTNDFEFIDMSGKQASVPKCKAGFEWNGRAIKKLAGSGCLYVRYTKSIGEASSDGSDSDLCHRSQYRPPRM